MPCTNSENVVVRNVNGTLCFGYPARLDVVEGIVVADSRLDGVACVLLLIEDVSACFIKMIGIQAMLNM